MSYVRCYRLRIYVNNRQTGFDSMLVDSGDLSRAVVSKEYLTLWCFICLDNFVWWLCNFKFTCDVIRSSARTHISVVTNDMK
jgi:hypothetical protein